LVGLLNVPVRVPVRVPDQRNDQRFVTDSSQEVLRG
jgi:hypothetical protein